MAQRVHIILTDDIDGTEATETVRFGLDGRNYEIDLSSQNADQLRTAIRPYAEQARRVSSTRRGQTSPASRNQAGTETKKIRAWALEHGYEISHYGRVHRHIKDAYYESLKK